MGKEIWLSMHARHFGFEKIIRTRPSVRPLLHVSQGEIFHFKYPGVNCITTWGRLLGAWLALTVG